MADALVEGETLGFDAHNLGLFLYVVENGAGAAEITIAIGAYAFGQFIGAPLWGKLSDLWGRRRQRWEPAIQKSYPWHHGPG